MFDIKEYNKNGYIKINDVIDKSLLLEFNKEISHISKNLKKKTNRNEDKFSNFLKNFENRKTAYQLLQDLRSVKKISSKINDIFEKKNIYKKLNFKSPSIKNALIVSLPKETKFNNPLHQDIYNYNSELFIKVWAPLTEVNEKNGSMCVYKKSHKMGFIKPEFDGLDYYPMINNSNIADFDYEIFKFKPGSIIIFNPLILHKSVNNISSKTRFVVGCDIQDISKLPSKKSRPDISAMKKVSLYRHNKRKKIDY